MFAATMATLLSSSTTFICKTPKLNNLAIFSKPPINKFKKNSINLYPIPYSFCTNDKSVFFNLPSSSCRLLSTKISAIISTDKALSSSAFSSTAHQHYWIVVMDTPPKVVNSRAEIIDYYVKIIETVLGSEKDAEMCIYDASCETHFGFCCHVDEEIARKIACLPGVLSVRPDPDFNIVRKDCSYYKVPSNTPSTSSGGNTRLFPPNNTKHWLVHVEKPTDEAMAKPQVVDYYVQILMKILGNETDAQMCIYNGSWESNYGFCCELDDVCAQELAGVPGVLSVQPDEDMGSDNIGYGGGNPGESSNSPDSIVADQTINIGTKKLFVTGLSFYTSEKTLRAAFESFGELVEVRIIMDKISKRSRGYAFIEYTTEAAASAALKEMNGKIINGWMIVVDVAKKNPTNYNRQRKTAF